MSAAGPAVHPILGAIAGVRAQLKTVRESQALYLDTAGKRLALEASPRRRRSWPS